MKKIVFLSLFAFCLPWMLVAQSIDDDLYYVPSKGNKEQKRTTSGTSSSTRQEVVVKSNAPTTVYSSQGGTTVVVRDRKGNSRDVDEYNRRYTSKENNFSYDNDTLYVDKKDVPDPDGEWVNGFDGSQDDYEYAMRIVRFRNPRYAISISSPLYWDVVYGMNTWDWNVYTDGMYAYAFPTFSNRLWWDWRYNSYGWGSPYYSGWGYPSYAYGGYYGDWGYGYGGWYGGWGWSGGYYHRPGWGWGGGYYGGGSYYGGGTYTNRRFTSSRPTGETRRVVASDRSGSSRGDYMVGQDGTLRRTSSYDSSVRRVIGTRSSDDVRRGISDRTDAASSRSSIYTRPSSTRSSSYDSDENGLRRSRSYNTGSDDVRSNRSSAPSNRTYSSERSSGNGSTYSRGSSDYPRSSESSSRSYNNNNTRSSRSYDSGSSYSSGSSSRSSGSSFSGGGGSSRSSGGGYSGGGGSSLRSGGSRR